MHLISSAEIGMFVRDGGNLAEISEKLETLSFNKRATKTIRLPG